MAAGFSGILRKATDVLQNLGIGDAVRFPGKDGDIIYSKNNVCVHPPIRNKSSGSQESTHAPGYLTIHCQKGIIIKLRDTFSQDDPKDDVLGVTLVLQWLPNSTLEKNPRSIHTISPRAAQNFEQSRARIKLRHLHGPKKQRRESSSDSSSSPVHDTAGDTTTPNSETEGENPAVQEPEENNEQENGDISVEMNGDQLTVTSTPKDRPQTLSTLGELNNDGLGIILKLRDTCVPSINVIPHTPISPTAGGGGGDDGSPDTSGADDDISDGEGDGGQSSPYTSEGEGMGAATPTGENDMEPVSSLLLSYKNHDFLEKSPEEFAQSHNMMLPDGIRPSDDVVNNSRVSNQKTPSLFSVDLGKMRSMRLFYSNPEYTSGQLVIASPESQYKILHFHCGGLDKLGQIFEQWNAVRAKSVKSGSPDPRPDRHFAVCRPEISKNEQDPEEDLYESVTWDFWKASTNAEGAIEDSMTIRKATFFCGLEASLRKEAWPFLLNVYPWTSSREQRETIRNDLFLEYQKIKKKRMKNTLKIAGKLWQSVDNTIHKDVVRTDRKHPYYEGDDNPNVETMRNILMNYAAFCPQIGYIQGMSDLLAPILATIQHESDSFWCFAGLMQRTIFVSIPRNNNMDKNIEYLRELLKLMLPDFFKHLQGLGSEALQLMFTHRWILLCFKREFSDEDALRIWEACWADYHTRFFHLFVSAAIIASYGEDALAQKLQHDEILLYFSSVAMHMNISIVLKKARGLLNQFCRMDKIPCTLAGLCDYRSGSEMWDNVYQPTIECVQIHDTDEPCPYEAGGI